MNRVFPGDPDSDKYEERKAAELIEEVGDLKVLDLHSTSSEDAPFAILEYPSDKQIEMLKSTGLGNAADMTHVGAKNPELDFIALEVSKKSENPEENVFDHLTNFLAAEGVIEAEYEISKPDVFRVYETVEGRDYRFAAKNFQKVDEGEVFAKNKNETKAAEEEFYPVLMSTDGYEEIIGFKAKKLENIN